MVSNQALGAICVDVGLHEHLMFESFDLASKIRAYTENLMRKRNAEYELAKEEGRAPGQYWIDVIPPKVRPRSSVFFLTGKQTVGSGAL
jgi:endoribonuclease Dicer